MLVLLRVRCWSVRGRGAGSRGELRGDGHGGAAGGERIRRARSLGSHGVWVLEREGKLVGATNMAAWTKVDAERSTENGRCVEKKI